MTEVPVAPSNTHGRISFFHFTVVGLSLMLTLSAWQFSKIQVETRTESRFEAARDRAIGLISDRMTKYEDALWSGVAAVESHGGDISYDDWRVFSDNLRIDQRYPGINGIGIIHYHTAETLGGYLAEQRRERPDFRIFPDHNQPIYMPITLIEPEASNAAAVGLDVAHELNRRTAALTSRDEGKAQITGPIVLVQDAEQTPGFLFYAPFYKGGSQSEISARQESFLGAVYAPFVVHKLMEGLLAKELREVRFSISDADQIIYDEHDTQDPSIDPNPLFSEQVSLDLYGRTWTMDMRSNLLFRQENTYAQPTVILLAGLLIEALIISLLFLMSRANSRAVEYADRVTVALRHEKEKLVSTNLELGKKNDELERFTYIASHDLKTPIRGIRGLTEMVQEDLGDYFTSPDANPEVRTNLEWIHDRVARMEQLTNGILEISRVNAASDDGGPIQLDRIIAGLRLDFGLGHDQLLLSGAAATVSVDPMNFQSVLENLIGNAVKYHADPEKLQINISAAIEDGRLSMSVADNGPGIDPKFHERIFDIFQTLRCGKDVESTGIGLSIVKKAVECHGGAVSLDSSLGKGSTFFFTWPHHAETSLTNPIEAAA